VVFITDRRLQLQALLEGIPGIKNAYYQAPPADMMEYPCIIYELDNRDTNHADNNPYRITKRYQVTVIYWDADSDIPDAVAHLPLCSFSRKFIVNNLHHEVFNIYF
jgi:hypothetical protein